MSAVAGALEPLDDQDAVRRVLTWASQHFFGSATGATAEDMGLETPPPEATSAAAHGHETLAEFFNAASPATLEDKVLIAAYWAQEVEKREALRNRLYDHSRACQRQLPVKAVQTQEYGASLQRYGKCRQSASPVDTNPDSADVGGVIRDSKQSRGRSRGWGSGRQSYGRDGRALYGEMGGG